MKSLFLNALGMNNALGDSVNVVAKKLFGDSPSGLEPSDVLISGRTSWVGKVKAMMPSVPAELEHYNCRNNTLLLGAFEQIKSSLEPFIAKFGSQRIGIVIGTSTSGISEGEKDFKRKSDLPVRYRRQEIGNSALFLADFVGVKGPRFTVSTACSSSKKAFASAKRLLDADLCDAVVVGGSDSICDLTLNGFDALESLSTDICNPFSKNRKGINIGEGAALFIMSREESEIRLMGIGESSDGYHLSAPDPEGRGAGIAMQAALDDAQIAGAEVGYINLHGTATQKNDEMESKVVERILGSGVIASSTKPLIGHTLGSAGAQELAFCYMTLSKEMNPGRALPIHHWDGVRDELLSNVQLATRHHRLNGRVCMSNSFAFGGSNAAVILGVNG